MTTNTISRHRQATVARKFYFKRKYARSICDRKYPEDGRPGRSNSLIVSGLALPEH